MMDNKGNVAVCTPICKKKYPLSGASSEWTYIDLRKVVAVDTPEDKEAKSFRIYFDNAIWRLDVKCYNGFITDWLQVL
jgi:hypothetical protein